MKDMKKTVLLFCVFTVFTAQAFSEGVYTVDLKKDLILGGVSLGVFVPPLFLDPIGGSDNPLGDRDSVNAFDRPFMAAYNKPLDIVGTVGQFTMLALPAVSLIGNIRDLNAVLTYGIMYGEALLLTWGTKDLLKFAVARNRPYTYFGDVPAGEEKDYYNSFPSGHTAFAFMGATFLSTTFWAEYPDSKWKIPVIAGSYALAAGVAAMRIGSGNHFLTDVLAGAAIGSLYGWLIPYLHLRRDESQAVSIIPVVNGVMVSIKY
jgi:undecaprenyl-diphosphatase